jgi:hypothetical protein
VGAVARGGFLVEFVRIEMLHGLKRARAGGGSEPWFLGSC